MRSRRFRALLIVSAALAVVGLLPVRGATADSAPVASPGAGVVVATSHDSVAQIEGTPPPGRTLTGERVGDFGVTSVKTVGKGFLTNADTMRPAFVIQLAGPGIEEYRAAIVSAAMEISRTSGVQLHVQAGTVAASGSYDKGVIRVQRSASSPCGSSGGIVGCGGYAGAWSEGKLMVNAGNVWLHDSLQRHSAGVKRSTVYHELGHALGLNHYEPNFQGVRQIMYPYVEDHRTTFAAGDLAGFAHLRPSSTAAPDPRPFVDVPEGSWFHNPVYWLYDRDVTTGCGSVHLFCPADPTLRSQAVTFLHRLAGTPTAPLGTRFSDVPSKSWYTTSSRWARGVGLSTGVGGTNRFEPNRMITRAEMITLLYRFAGSPKQPSTRVFADVPPSSWYGPAVAWAKKHQITTGVGGSNRFEPTRTVTRAEVAAFLQRYATTPAAADSDAIEVTVR